MRFRSQRENTPSGPRRTIIGIAALIAGTLAAGGLVVPAAHAAPVTLNILAVNDFHGRINATTAAFAETIEGLRAGDGAGGANTLLVGAGDLIGASEFASALAQDQPTIDVLNELDMVASAVGNHEFDAGWPDLRDRVIAGGGNAQWDYLGANVYLAGTETPALPEYGLYEAAGVTVGVIGAVTQETPTLVSPGGVVDLSFGDPVAAVNRVAGQLSDGDEANGEADVLVATYHEGAPNGAVTLEQNQAASAVFNRIVTETAPEVDAILNGHTHQAYAYSAPVPGAPGTTRPVLQTGQYAANVGQISLTVETDTNVVTNFTVRNVPRVAAATSQYPRVVAVDAIVKAALATAAVVGNEPVGTLSDDVTTAMTPAPTSTSLPYPGFARDDRSKESTLGTLVADALLDTLAPAENGGAQLTVVNPGGLRGELKYAADPTNPADADGRILYSEANAVLPFVNNLATVDLTGAQLKTLFEQQWQRDAAGNVPSRAYLQLGTSTGFSYTFDESRPEGDRITSMTLNGSPIDPAATYRVGTFTFLTGFGSPATAGGDNFRIFQEATNYQDSGLVDRDAWIAYLRANQPVGPDFRKHAVSVSGLNANPTAGTTQRLSVGTLDFTSIDSPANTLLTAVFAETADGAGAVDAGSASVSGGAATIDVTIPETASGPGFLILTAQPTGTRVVIPLQVAEAVVPVKSWTFGWPSTFIARQGATISFTTLVFAADGSAPTGALTIYDGSTPIATATLTEADDGYLRVPLPQLSRGTHRLYVAYSGSDTVEPSRSRWLPVRIL